MGTNPSQRLLTEQARGYICGKLGCDWRFALPLQVRKETREVLCECATCHEQVWKQFPPDAYARFIEDAAAGKVC